MTEENTKPDKELKNSIAGIMFIYEKDLENSRGSINMGSAITARKNAILGLSLLFAHKRHQLKEQVLAAIGYDEPNSVAYDQERNQVRKEIKKSIEAVFEGKEV